MNGSWQVKMITGLTDIVGGLARLLGDLLELISKLIVGLIAIIERLLIFILSIIPWLAVGFLVIAVVFLLIDQLQRWIEHSQRAMDAQNPLQLKGLEQKHQIETAGYQTRLNDMQEQLIQTQLKQGKAVSMIQQLENQLVYIRSHPANIIVEKCRVIERHAPHETVKPSKSQQITIQSYVCSVFEQVDKIDDNDVYIHVMEYLNYQVKYLERRYAMPYKVIVKLFDTLTEAQLNDFYRSFSRSIQALSGHELKRIYQNKSFSTKQKYLYFKETKVLENTSDLFHQFFHQAIKKYTFKQLHQFYDRFEKVWQIKHYQGQVTVVLPNEQSVSLFKDIWYAKFSTFNTIFMVDPKIKKGVVVQSKQFAIDMSYSKLLEQVLEKNETEVIF